MSWIVYWFTFLNFSFKVSIECPMDCKSVYLQQGTRNIVHSCGWKQAATSLFGSSTLALFKCVCNLDADVGVHSNDVCHLLHCRCEKLFPSYPCMRCHSYRSLCFFIYSQSSMIFFSTLSFYKQIVTLRLLKECTRFLGSQLILTKTVFCS